MYATVCDCTVLIFACIFVLGLFFKVAANLGDKGKQIVEENSPEAIEALRTETVRLVVQVGSEFINVDRPLISTEIRAMLDTICYMSVHGYRSMFEKTSVTRRAAFNEYTLKIAIDYEDEFYSSWKSNRAEHPVEIVERSRGEDFECERLINVLMGDDDDGAGPAPAAGPAPVSEVAAAAEVAAD